MRTQIGEDAIHISDFKMTVDTDPSAGFLPYRGGRYEVYQAHTKKKQQIHKMRAVNAYGLQETKTNFWQQRHQN